MEDTKMVLISYNTLCVIAILAMLLFLIGIKIGQGDVKRDIKELMNHLTIISNENERELMKLNLETITKLHKVF